MDEIYLRCLWLNVFDECRWERNGVQQDDMGNEKNSWKYIVRNKTTAFGFDGSTIQEENGFFQLIYQ